MKGSRGGHGIASSIVIINHESPSLSSSIISLIPMVVVTVRRLMLVGGWGVRSQWNGDPLPGNRFVSFVSCVRARRSCVGAGEECIRQS